MVDPAVPIGAGLSTSGHVPGTHERGGHGARTGKATVYMRRRRRVSPDRAGDPMEAMGNLFDVAILIAVGFLVTALAAFGLQELVTAEDVTIVKDPGTAEMEIITKSEGKVERLQRTDEMAEGQGLPIGTVYRLEDGSTIWVPNDSAVETP